MSVVEVPELMYLTVLAPIVSLTEGEDPSVGTSLIVEVALKITTFEKSPPGLVQLTVTCVSPGEVEVLVTSDGERLSIVRVFEFESLPACELVDVNAVTLGERSYPAPETAGILA